MYINLSSIVLSLKNLFNCRDLVVEELSRDNLEDRDNGEEREIEEDIFISDSEEGEKKVREWGRGIGLKIILVSEDS